MAVDRRRICHKKDRLRQLRVFCRVAQMGGFARAAEVLDLTQPAVSLQVRELEHEMEAILFNRTGRGLSLSPAGERLYKLAEPLVRGMDGVSAEYVKEIGDITSRRIHFGASPAIAAFIVPAHLCQFQALYPAMQLQVRTCLVSEGVQRLLDVELEFVIGENKPAVRNRQDIQYHHVAYYDYVLITAPDHPLAGRETVSLEEIAAYPAVVPPPGMGNRQREDTGAQRFGFEWNIAIEVGRWGVIKRYVEQGLGASIVPSFCISENDELSTVPLKDSLPAHSYGVITRRGQLLTSATSRLIQLMAPDYPAQNRDGPCRRSAGT